MSYTLDSLGIVLRTSGERTTDLIVSQVKRLFPDSKFAIVNEKPFFKAIIKTYETAIEQNTKFTLAIDADLILAENSPQIIFRAINNFDLSKDLRQHFLVYDKFIGERDAGSHLYNTQLLPEVHKHFLREGKEDIFRPESSNVREFAEANNYNTEAIIQEHLGYHAFRQYYKNIYQSMYNLAIKKKNRHSKVKKVDLLQDLKIQAEEYKDDPDFKIAALGFTAGIDQQEVILDVDRYFDVKPLLEEHNLSEKSPISLI